MTALRRLSRILWTAGRYRLLDLLDPEQLARTELPRRYLWLARLSPTRLLPSADAPRGARLRLAMTDLGPVFIKFGQLLSTRRDLIPPDIADELAALQDKVPPFPGAQAEALVSQALGQPVSTAFARFDREPIASASVAQVHGAELADGSQVVVKVVRPGIEAVIREDLAILKRLAVLLEEHFSDARRLHLKAVVADYERTILDELNLMLEASNTRQLRQNFAESPLLYVPRVYSELCRPNVLVLERIYGIPIGDLAALRAAGTDMKVLAERGVETFFTQVFVHNFFHADMHPGNIFVDVSDPASPHYIAVDCAIIGSLTREDQNYLARNLLAFFNQDYGEVARLHVESGWIPPDTDAERFEAVIRAVCEPIFAKPLSEISFGEFLVELFQTARSFDMEIQPQLVLLQKTLLYIEGLGRQLYPELDLWQTAKPFMENWMAERVGPAAALKALAEYGPQFIDQLPELPALMLNASRQLRQLDYRLARHQQQIERLDDSVTRLHRRGRRQRLAGAALLLLAGVLLYSRFGDALQRPEDLGTVAGLLTAVLGSLLLLRA